MFFAHHWAVPKDDFHTSILTLQQTAWEHESSGPTQVSNTSKWTRHYRRTVLETRSKEERYGPVWSRTTLYRFTHSSLPYTILSTGVKSAGVDTIDALLARLPPSACRLTTTCQEDEPADTSIPNTPLRDLLLLSLGLLPASQTRRVSPTQKVFLQAIAYVARLPITITQCPSLLHHGQAAEEAFD